VYLHEDIGALQRLNLATADYVGIRQEYVYKDYFVCMALKEIIAVDPQLVFKGGTALSKCYDVIDRFSEDVDLGMDVAHPTEGMRKKTKVAVKTAAEVLGLSIINLEETRSRRLFNQYRLPLPQLIEGIAPDQLIIETALMSPTSPSSTGVIISFIGEYLLSESRQDLVEQYGLEGFSLNVISLKRTFVDKIFAISDYYLNGEIPYRQSRHVYDLYQLEQALALDATMGKLIEQVRSERAGRYRCASAAPDISLEKVLREIYDKQTYRQDYETVTLPLLNTEVDYETIASTILKIAAFVAADKSELPTMLVE